jgi:hypothetical protein
LIRIPIRYGNPWRWLLPLLLLPARGAYIRIDGDTMKVRLSWAFRMKFARSEVTEVAKHRPVLSIGVHGWRGRWLVNGAHRPIAIIRLAEPVPARVIGFPVRVRELWVSVDNRDVLRELLIR